MSKKTRVATSLLVLMTAATLACSWSIGGSESETTSRHPTVAEELRDLEAARKEGLISDEEHARLRARIVEGKED